MASLHERDPVIIDEMSNLKRSSWFLETNIEKAVEGVNRWTGINRWIKWEIDNTWSMKSFLVKKQGMSSKDVDQALEIPEDFDYVEVPSFVKTAWFVCW